MSVRKGDIHISTMQDESEITIKGMTCRTCMVSRQEHGLGPETKDNEKQVEGQWVKIDGGDGGHERDEGVVLITRVWSRRSAECYTEHPMYYVLLWRWKLASAGRTQIEPSMLSDMDACLPAGVTVGYLVPVYG